MPVPTPGPHGECPSSKFTDLDATLPDCYYLYVSTDSSSLTWDESNRQCAGLGFGSKLASIHSDEEMSRIHGGLLNKHTDLVAWIGLFTTAGAAADVYQWVDDTPYDFNNWEDGEPNSPGVELCVQAYAHNGKWNDAFCDQYYGTLGYLCKAPKGTRPGVTLFDRRSKAKIFFQFKSLQAHRVRHIPPLTAVVAGQRRQ